MHNDNTMLIHAGRPHRMAEDYVNLVGELMYPKQTFGPYGHRPEEARYPLNRVNTLGYIMSGMRR